MRNAKVGFVGFGRMGGLIAQRGLATGRFQRRNLIAFAPSTGTRRRIKQNGIRVAQSLNELLARSRFVWLCVKPQKMSEVLAMLRATGNVAGKSFISIAAGVETARIEKELGRNVSVLRVMPNTPSRFGAGMSAVSRGRFASTQDERTVTKVLAALGEVVKVSEKKMHAVTAISGSGPAYIFYMAEALTRAARQAGLDEKVAAKLVRQTIFGAGKMLRESADSAGELRKQVTSPGGTTEAALKEFARRDFEKIVSAGVQKAVKRSKELSRKK
jgi:pyrroline-5-carboxylate reductase